MATRRTKLENPYCVIATELHYQNPNIGRTWLTTEAEAIEHAKKLYGTAKLKEGQTFSVVKVVARVGKRAPPVAVTLFK